jgi:hypothetical protein
MNRQISKRNHSAVLLIALIAISLTTLSFNIPRQVNAQSVILTVTSPTGTDTGYTLAQLQQNFQAITGYGGFYQINQNQINPGNWTGTSLYDVCYQNGLTSTCNISVVGQGTNNFTYAMVANGTGLNVDYKTYNNATGAAQNQTLSVTLLLAYSTNGTALSGNNAPAPRLVIVGPEGLLILGTGGRSITQITMTNVASAPTPAPTPTPTPTPSPTPTPTLTPSPTPTASPTSTPAPTPSPTSTATPTPSSTPEPTFVSATIDNGTIISLDISGNITSSQMTNISVTTNLSVAVTTISFNLTGATGSIGSGNITIPKSIVASGTIPTVLIDGAEDLNQSYTEDATNYYVSYNVHFSTHEVLIIFAPVPTVTPTVAPTMTASPTVPPTALPTASPTPTATPQSNEESNLVWIIAAVIAVVIVVGIIAFVISKKKQ